MAKEGSVDNGTRECCSHYGGSSSGVPKSLVTDKVGGESCGNSVDWNIILSIYVFLILYGVYKT